VNFVADESIDQEIVKRVREDGHTVSYVAEMDPGISDDDVLRLANKQSALLITADRDFGELVFRQRLATNGVLLIRLAGLSQSRRAEMVSSAIKKHVSEIPNAFSVVTPGTIRIRYMPRSTG
jgi:predicted nuclease of predicted toxin-antitoxin system